MDDFGVEWGSSCLYEEPDYEYHDIYEYNGEDIEAYYPCSSLELDEWGSCLYEEPDYEYHDIYGYNGEDIHDDKVVEVEKSEKSIELYSSSEINYFTFSYGKEKDVKKWIGLYSSSQRILLVGEGNYSFSLSLAKAFRSARNIVATSLDSLQDLEIKYSDGVGNVTELVGMGGQALCGLDATQMMNVHFLTTHKFDRIVYNFPHVGFGLPEDNGRQITMNKDLVKGFLRNAKVLLKKDKGEIHVTHKNGYPYDQWDLEIIAQEIGLVLHGTILFHKHTYPGYFNKRGHGRLPDDSFRLGPCTTYKFRLPQTSR